MNLPDITEQELKILQHTTGLTDIYNDRSYRNHFVAGDGHDDMPTIMSLCKKGLMQESNRPAFLSSGDRCFSATFAGLSAAKSLRRRPTRGQRRYHNWLEISDCCPDLTFGDFLRDPQFASAR